MAFTGKPPRFPYLARAPEDEVVTLGKGARTAKVFSEADCHARGGSCLSEQSVCRHVFLVGPFGGAETPITWYSRRFLRITYTAVGQLL